MTAQAAATLAQMFPGRHWVALGSGQALNEHVTGDPWPSREERNARLEECVQVIRALFAGETVSHEGRVRVDRAKLWSLPEQPPALYAAAVTPATAARSAAWADGLITINQPDEAQAATLAIAHDQWREAALPGDAGWEMPLPEHFEEVAQFLQPPQIEPFVHVSADLGEHTAWLARQAELGFDQVMVHHVGQDQRPFLDAFAERVLPELSR